MLRATIATLFLGLAFLIPFYYYDLMKFSVINLNAGWVFSTIYIRFFCIIFFAIALNLIFSLFKKTSKIKFYKVFLISLIPGFGISFIAPIYNTDYGDFSDSVQLDSVERLIEFTEGRYYPGDKKHLVAFFSTDCGHCRNVSAKLGINQMAGQETEVHAFFSSPLEEIKSFVEDCNGSQFNSYQMGNADLFLSISGFELPSIFLIDEDYSTIKHWAGDVVNYTALDYIRDIEP